MTIEELINTICQLIVEGSLTKTDKVRSVVWDPEYGEPYVQMEAVTNACKENNGKGEDFLMIGPARATVFI